MHLGELADINTIPALKSRDTTAERAIVDTENSSRRDFESTRSIVGKEGHRLSSRAGRTLKERWGLYPDDDFVSLPPDGSYFGSPVAYR